jgi:hypothetical protein
MYSSETRRFLNLVPVTSWEGFVQMSPSQTLHGFCRKRPLEPEDDAAVQWLINVLPNSSG